MANAILIVLCSAALAGLIMLLLRMTRLYQDAEKMGFRVLFTPISVLSPIPLMFPAQTTDFLRALPFGMGNFINYSTFSNYFDTKYTLHEAYGEVFVHITTSDVVVHVANAPMADEILSRRKDFIKPPPMYEPLDFFGRNVDTVNGEDWQRHRRLTTPPFNERNSNHVWRESLTQSRDMLTRWTRNGKAGIVTIEDTLTLALHVLTSAGFGKRYDFEGGVTQLPKGHAMTYKDALRTVLNHVYIVMFLTAANLPGYLLPRKLREVREAKVEFAAYMAEMVEEEKQSMDKTDAEKDNLMSVLIRASESENQARNGLSNSEIFGNLFIYNLAGHETTANTLAYATLLMATDIKWQKWIREELIEVFGDKDQVEDWEYEAAFPKLKRCMALMNETLRLYGPVLVVPKNTGDTPATIALNDTTITIPAQAFVCINVVALHTSPAYWGENALTWQPDRWIVPGQDGLYQPPPGTFIPWASGPRVCPGKKFSQVEFVAVVARLFKRHRVDVVLKEGESKEEAVKRAFECMKDSGLTITLQMRHPEKVRLVWREWD